MRTCRSCGTKNPDDVNVCAECGLDLSPSPVMEFMAKLRAVGQSPHAVWFRRIALAFVALFGFLAVYLLSFGPVARLYGANPYNLLTRLPPALRILYSPMDHIPMPTVLSTTLRRYNYWCMGIDRQQKDFLALMVRIDEHITAGMPYSEVVSSIGQPLWSDTNGNQVHAIFHFQAPAVGYELITNGFSIVFSNGLVVKKSPSTSTMR